MAQPESSLVLGGSGLLGRDIAQKLVEAGHIVSVLDIVQRYNDIPFYSGDITDRDAVLSTLQKTGATCVFHTISPLATEAESEAFWKVNVEGTKRVISACVEAGVRKLVYTSSSGVVFSGTPIINVDETFPLPTGRSGDYAYHESKTAAEKLVLEANGKDGLLTCALRPSGVFGPGDRVMVTSMWTQYENGKTGVQIGDNRNLVDWTSVRNVSDAHILAAKYLDSPLHPDAPVAGEAFFITNDEPWPFWDFANAVWDRFDGYYPGKRVKKKPFVIPGWLGMIMGTLLELHGRVVGKKPIMTRYVVLMTVTPRWHNISKAKRALGYVPKVKLEDELDNMVKWWIETKDSGKEAK